MDLLAFAAALTVMGAIIAAFLALRQATATPAVLERRLGALLGQQSALQIAAAGAEALRPQRKGRLPFIGAVLEGKDWTELTASRLESADIGLTVSEFVALRTFLALVAAAPTVLLFGGLIVVPLVAVAAYAAFSVPNLYVSLARGKRQKRITEQLPEMLTMVSNSLKAGFGLMQALDLASRELSHPISTELRRAIQEVSVGSTREEALQNMSRRGGSADLDIVITAMLVQQSTGGNLSEILDNVAHTMRERIRIRGEIKTLTSQQMLSGVIIGALPLFMLGAFSVMSPDYMHPLLHETVGRVMLIGAALMEFFGVVLIRRILAIEV